MLFCASTELFLCVLDTSVKTEASQKKISDEDDDIFGSYAPSAISSRPGTGRSVRYEVHYSLLFVLIYIKYGICNYKLYSTDSIVFVIAKTVIKDEFDPT